MLKNCLKCNKEFRYSPSESTRKFCSRDCYWLDKKGKPSSRKGAKLTVEQLKRLSDAHLGQVAWNKGTRGLSLGWPKGLSRTDQVGSKNWRWISDRTKVKRYWTERNNPEYKKWRMNVWVRDSFKCRIANEDCSGRIEAHHILGWTKHVELRYEINNGITLCHAHHPKKRAEEKRLAPRFQELVSVSKE